MKNVRVVLKGVAPLFTDPMDRATLEGLRTGKRPQIPKDRPAKDEAEGKVPTDPDRRIAIPIDNLNSCLVAAGQVVKIGKRQISSAERTDLYDLLTLKGDYIYLTDGNPNANGDAKQPTWKTDMRRGVGKQAKPPTAVCITRPRFDEWGFAVEFEYDDTTVDPSNLVKLFEKAGATQGLGGFRPNKGRGRFGRFRIVEWHETDIPDVRSKVLFTQNGQEVSSLGNGKPAEEPKKKRGKKAEAETEPAPTTVA